MPKKQSKQDDKFEVARQKRICISDTLAKIWYAAAKAGTKHVRMRDMSEPVRVALCIHAGKSPDAVDKDGKLLYKSDSALTVMLKKFFRGGPFKNSCDSMMDEEKLVQIIWTKKPGGVTSKVDLTNLITWLNDPRHTYDMLKELMYVHFTIHYKGQKCLLESHSRAIANWYKKECAKEKAAEAVDCEIDEKSMSKITPDVDDALVTVLTHVMTQLDHVITTVQANSEKLDSLLSRVQKEQKRDLESFQDTDDTTTAERLHKLIPAPVK